MGKEKNNDKQPEKEIDTNNGKVVKFEKKTPAPDFNGQITYIKIPVKKEIPIIMYKRENDRGHSGGDISRRSHG